MGLRVLQNASVQDRLPLPGNDLADGEAIFRVRESPFEELRPAQPPEASVRVRPCLHGSRYGDTQRTNERHTGKTRSTEPLRSQRGGSSSTSVERVKLPFRGTPVKQHAVATEPNVVWLDDT
ncbi:hypothetical protein HRbin30_02261 [bacterium HR30]|nr:hypothetical protein HRbin30_02261 [bacterium HR30]